MAAPLSSPQRALVLAAQEMLAAETPSGLSGRRIAEAAGVNYGQIHRHFGTKQALLADALARLGDDFVTDAFPPGAVVPGPGVLNRHVTFVRAQFHAVLDRASVGDLGPRGPIIQRYRAGLSTLRPDLDDDHLDTIVALSTSMQLGVVAHRSSLSRAAGIDDDEDIDGELAIAIEQLHAGRGTFAGPPPPPRSLRHNGVTETTIPPKTGRAGAELRLVNAAVAMLYDRAPAAIPGRQLAAAADVNYGLIHHYFGSAGEVLERASAALRDDYYRAEAAEGRVPDFFSAARHPGYVRAVTHISLDPKLSATGSHFPVVEALLAAASREGDVGHQTRTRYLISTSAQLAWALFTPALSHALKRDTAEITPLAAAYLHRFLNANGADNS
ncbi:MAG: TetR family transcriptional regulator [Actinomycetota bacterium]|jgi:AcrR family transcriptional regulator|nr:TetR family transcriptional regulator [Actinomycetota bacterium]